MELVLTDIQDYSYLFEGFDFRFIYILGVEICVCVNVIQILTVSIKGQELIIIGIQEQIRAIGVIITKTKGQNNITLFNKFVVIYKLTLEIKR